MPLNQGAAHTLKWRVWCSVLATPHLSTISPQWRVMRTGSNSIIQRKSFIGWALWNTYLSFSSRIYGIGVFILTSSWSLRLWGCEEWIFKKLIWEFGCTLKFENCFTEIWKICPQKSSPPIRIDDRKKVGSRHSASIGGALAPSQILSTLLFCLLMTQRDGMGREVGVGFRMGNRYTPVADSCWCMAKPIQYCQVKKTKNKNKNKKTELPWWSSGEEFALLCRGHGFDPWSRKTPRTSEQLCTQATTTDPRCSDWRPRALQPVLGNKISHLDKKPAHGN